MPPFNIKNIVRPHVLTLTPYSSARDEYTGTEGIFLDANENPLGAVTAEDWSRYPDPHQWEIKQKLAPIKGVKLNQVFLGNGSDEPIDLLIRACCTPRQDSILTMPPTYGMYEVSANINDVGIVSVPLTSDFQIDTPAVLKAIASNTKIVWICSPNNPSGNLLDNAAIGQILENFGGVVVVDEAYIDFAPVQSWTQQLEKYPNLVVLQTFSKAWGLASLRLGMCFASEEIIQVLNKIKPPYNLSGVAQKLLLEALDKEPLKNEMVAKILAERDNFCTKLADMSLVKRIYPSDANFLLVQFDNAPAVMQHLIDTKIIVRDRSKVVRCGGCLRITVGTAQENEALINALKTITQPPIS